MGRSSLAKADIQEHGHGFNRRIDKLREAMEQADGYSDIIFGFNETVFEIHDSRKIPDPKKGTNLDLALSALQPLNPRHTLLIADGAADDPNAALTQAAKLSGVISVIFIGYADDKEAMAFLDRIAKKSGPARDLTASTSKQLQSAIGSSLARYMGGAA
jgi:hypothetical protein